MPLPLAGARRSPLSQAKLQEVHQEAQLSLEAVARKPVSGFECVLRTVSASPSGGQRASAHAAEPPVWPLGLQHGFVVPFAAGPK
jgi:hypothetical protein